MGVDRRARREDADRVPDISERTSIDEVERRLIQRYATLPPAQVSTAVRQAHARFEQSRIWDFVPLLVERRAGHELAHVTGL
ncbi:MAG: hypothetical protein QOI39_857 [Mycobacterium sp.]|nr:hypothetical protein [Mycobacterium sp.]